MIRAIAIPKPDPIALGVINEPEVNEGMTTDLRADFKKRHRKHLHEVIKVVASLAKKTCLDGVQEEPMKDAHPMPVSLLDAAGSNNVPTAGKETCPA